MLSRGIVLSPIGSLKDQLVRKGLEIEQIVKMNMVEGIIRTIQVTSGNKETSKVIEEIIKDVKNCGYYDVFTTKYAEEHKNKVVNDKEILAKLNKLA